MHLASPVIPAVHHLPVPGRQVRIKCKAGRLVGKVLSYSGWGENLHR
jgi:hypothetical protein